ncbi:MAG TPA: hypothetical protein VLE22_00775, partial [Bryobacteraceae bacterium]|nr:hypothetical protein [Bryobacteraceae bacterium]
MVRQANTTDQQLSLMRMQFESADRPWLVIDASVATPLTIDDAAAHVGFDFLVTNTGRSPAQNIWIRPELVPSVLLMNSTAKQRRNCWCNILSVNSVQSN